MYSQQEKETKIETKIKINEDSTIDETVKTLFSTDDHPQKIKKNLLKICYHEVLNRFCFVIRDNHIVLDYRYFKFIANKENYAVIIQTVVGIMRGCLEKHELMIVHLNMKSLTLVDIDRHYSFIRDISEIMQRTFPDKLRKCFVYNAPFLFSQLYNTISMFIDKTTQKKIQLVSS